jgi:hypothetical protein
MLFRVHSQVTNKGGTKLYRRDRHCKAKVKGDSDHDSMEGMRLKGTIVKEEPQ